MKYIAIPVFLSGFVCSVAVARTLYYEYNDQCPGYYSTTPASGATQCSPSMRVWEIGWYDAVSKVAENGTESSSPQTLPALAQCGAASTPSGNYLDNPNDWQTYFNNPKICYPGYGYVAEGTTGNLTGFHCELNRPQADGVLHKIILKSNDGNTTYAELPYVATQCGSGYTYFVWSGSGRNSTRIGEYLPDDLVQLINNKRTGYSLRGFTTTPNVSDVASTATDALSGTLFGTRDSASNAYYRAFPDGQTMLNGNGDIVLYASWYRDCANDACSVDTWLNGAVRYWTNCGAYAVLGGSETYNPECGTRYYVKYSCQDGTQFDGYTWRAIEATPGSPVVLPSYTVCDRSSDPDHWRFDGWNWEGATFGTDTTSYTFQESDFYGLGSSDNTATRIVSLTAGWTGADDIGSATNRTDCETAGGHWCTPAVDILTQVQPYRETWSCKSAESAATMCCHDDPSRCNWYQCTSGTGLYTNAGDFWNIPANITNAPMEQHLCQVSDPGYVTFNIDITKFYGFHVFKQSSAFPSSASYFKPGYKKTDELSSPWYYANNNSVVGDNSTSFSTGYPTGVHRVTKLDFVPTYYTSALFPGYEFDGWYTGENCAGTKCIDGQGNVLANSACNTSVSECWREIDKTEPSTGAIKVYFGTCSYYLQCGEFKTTASGYDATKDHGTWYGPLYVHDEYYKTQYQTYGEIPVFSDPDLTQPATVPTITGMNWYFRLAGEEQDDSTAHIFPMSSAVVGNGGSGNDFRTAAFNPTTFSSSGDGRNRLMVSPAPDTAASIYKTVSRSCGTGGYRDAAECTNPSKKNTSGASRISVTVPSDAIHYDRAPSTFYVGPITDRNNTYLDRACQCVKDGKFPCAWQTNNGRVLKTGVYYNGWDEITSLTAIYECSE